MPAIKRKAADSGTVSEEEYVEAADLEVEQDFDANNEHEVGISASSSAPSQGLSREESALQRLPLEVLEEHLPKQKQRCMEILSGKLPPGNSRKGSECIALQDEWHTLYNMLYATVHKQESNSCLLIGASGSGKSMLLDSVLRSISDGHGDADGPDSEKRPKSQDTQQQPFYRISISGTIQIDDRAAMKEMAQQLILQGAFTEEDVGDQIDAELTGRDDEEDPDSEVTRPPNGNSNGDQVFGGEDGSEDDEDQGAEEDQDAEIQDELAGAILSSLNNIIAHIIALLSSAPSSSSSGPTSSGSRKPLIIVLDNFDLFTARPRQALLYCLLDAVQAASYGAGLAVVGLTSRVDTTDLLEKRVKSRFSHRIIHVRPPSSYETFEKIVRAALQGGADESGPTADRSSSRGISSNSGEAQFALAWTLEIESLLSHPLFRDVLRGIYELSNDVRMVYRILIGSFSRLTILEPTFSIERILESASVEVGDGMVHVLRDLTEPEMALLIAVKHLQTRDRQIFNFEMCFDELRRFAARDARDRLAVGSNTNTNLGNIGGDSSTPGASIANSANLAVTTTPFYADRKIALMAFHSLLALEILLPESYVSSLTITNPTIKPSASTQTSNTTGRSNNNQNTIRKEFWKVRSILSPPAILQAVKDRKRPIPINSSLVKWASSHG